MRFWWGWRRYIGSVVLVSGLLGCGVAGRQPDAIVGLGSEVRPESGGVGLAGLTRRFREADYVDLLPVTDVAWDWRSMAVGTRFRVRGNLYYRRVPGDPDALDLVVVDQAWLGAQSVMGEPFVLCTRGFASFELMRAWIEDLDARPYEPEYVVGVNRSELSTAFVTVERDRFKSARSLLEVDAIRTFRGYLMRNP